MQAKYAAVLSDDDTPDDNPSGLGPGLVTTARVLTRAHGHGVLDDSADT